MHEWLRRRAVRARRAVTPGRLGGALLALVIGAATTAGCEATAGQVSAQTPAHCTWTVGALGGETGPYSSLIRGYITGIRVAVDEINNRHSLPCRLVVRVSDTKGDVGNARAAARDLLGDPRLLVVIPFFSGDALRAGSDLDAAGVPVLTIASATVLTEQGWHRFFRLSASDAGQGLVDAEFITQQWHAQRVAVVGDGSTYGDGIASIVNAHLGDRSVARLTLGADPAPVVQQVAATDADVVYFGGYAPDAGRLVAALHKAHLSVRFLSGDGSDDPSFGAAAGSYATTAVVSCPCADPRQILAAAPFVDAVERILGAAPPAYSDDDYDGVQLVADAMEGAPTTLPITVARDRVVGYLRGHQPLQGITKSYQWTSTGELDTDPLQTVWFYTWSPQNQRFTAIGRAADFLTAQ